MKIEDRVSSLKSEVKKAIQSALYKEDEKEIIKQSNFLRELNQMDNAIQQFHHKLDGLFNYNEDHQPNNDETTKLPIPSKTKEFSKYGRKEEYIQYLRSKGINLIELSKSVFKTRQGNLVGIAYATAAGSNKKRWWLGLQPRQYSAIVFICQTSEEYFSFFIFPQNFYDKYFDHFSRDSEGNQLKFNLQKNPDGNYYLSIPDFGLVKVDEYINKFETLRGL